MIGDAAVKGDVDDTIAALATAPGKGAVAVIRVSGGATRSAVKALGVRLGSPRQACLRVVRDCQGRVLDRALVIWFPGPHSFTGEDCAELHVHGGAFVVESVLGALTSAGIRLAAPGEFSRRAFANGKMDLAQAEAVADLVDAESDAQARQALEQLGGALGRRYAAWREVLIDSLARLEVIVDFPDDDVGGTVAGLEDALAELGAALGAAVSDGSRGEWVREGYRVAVVGPPNAGKSSLFNTLVTRDAAIVADLPGTTRDVIEVGVSLAGYRVILADTAGLRQPESLVEAEGVRRARLWAETASRRLWVVDGSSDDEGWRIDIGAWRRGDLCVVNKADRTQGAAARSALVEAEDRGLTAVIISTRDHRAGLVKDWITRDVKDAMAGTDFPAVTRRRHKVALEAAAASVSRARRRLDQPELAAEDLRLAARALSSVTGAISTEDVLESVFATFCIGK